MLRLTSLFLLAWTTGVFADEPKPAADKGPAQPSEDSISAAKRDFAGIKAARDGLDQPAAKLPSLSTPDFSSGSAAPRPLTSGTTAADALVAKKSANWLVDAMMKPDQKESHDLQSKTPGGTKSERNELAGNGSSGATDSRLSADKNAELPSAERRVGPEFNPLTRYMSGWMTSQDYALLKPGLDGATSASLSSRGDPSLPSRSANAASLGDAGSALDLSAGNKAAPFALPKPAENPFLQSLNSGGAFTANPIPPQAVSIPGSSANASSAAPVEIPPPKSRIPDFAKPATDEKYFKQLKRF